MSLIRMLFASILVFAIFAAPGRAGEAAKANREILSDTIRANKKALVAVNLRLTDEEARASGPSTTATRRISPACRIASSK